MNTIMKKLIIASCVIFLFSCKNNEKKDETSKEEATVSHEDENRVWLSPFQIKGVNITFGKIEMKELTATIRANGALNVPNNHRASITSLYPGVIQSLNVQVGDDVKKGQVLATIANPQFLKLQEEYLSLKSKITLAEQEFQRQRDLNNGNAGAGRNLQTAEAELSGLTIRQAAVQQELQLMGIKVNRLSKDNLISSLTVVSPIDGVISELYAKIGSYADVSAPIADVVDNSFLHLDLNVFEKDLPLLKVGQIIHFTLTNNPIREYDAEIFSIGASFENESKTIPVHAKVNGNKIGLIDGMNITGIVSLNNALMPAVLNDAVVRDGGKYYIFMVIDDDSHAHNTTEDSLHHNNKGTSFLRIEVIPGISDMGYTSITPINELPPNAIIVTQSAFFINAKLVNSGEHEH